jgi:alpha-tubulin suppressor-like RCC1 family protein
MGDALPKIDFGSAESNIDVVLGDEHTCALLADNTLKCWGYADYGQLGVPEYFEEGIGDGNPAPEMGDNLQFLNLFRDIP